MIVRKKDRVVVLGITGKQGTFWTEKMIGYGTQCRRRHQSEARRRDACRRADLRLDGGGRARGRRRCRRHVHSAADGQGGRRVGGAGRRQAAGGAHRAHSGAGRDGDACSGSETRHPHRRPQHRRPGHAGRMLRRHHAGLRAVGVQARPRRRDLAQRQPRHAGLPQSDPRRARAVRLHRHRRRSHARHHHARRARSARRRRRHRRHRHCRRDRRRHGRGGGGIRQGRRQADGRLHCWRRRAAGQEDGPRRRHRHRQCRQLCGKAQGAGSGRRRRRRYACANRSGACRGPQCQSARSQVAAGGQ